MIPLQKQQLIQKMQQNNQGKNKKNEIESGWYDGRWGERLRSVETS